MKRPSSTVIAMQRGNAACIIGNNGNTSNWWFLCLLLTCILWAVFFAFLWIVQSFNFSHSTSYLWVNLKVICTGSSCLWKICLSSWSFCKSLFYGVGVNQKLVSSISLLIFSLINERNILLNYANRMGFALRLCLLLLISEVCVLANPLSPQE